MSPHHVQKNVAAFLLLRNTMDEFNDITLEGVLQSYLSTSEMLAHHCHVQTTLNHTLECNTAIIQLQLPTKSNVYSIFIHVGGN